MICRPPASPRRLLHRPASVLRIVAGVACIAAVGLSMAASRTQFLVSATVLPATQFTRLAAPEALLVTATDAARGYVDVVQPTRLSVRSNTAGFVLDVHTVVPVLAGIAVYGLRGSVTLAGEGGSIVARDPPAGVSDLDLTFHLVLSPGTPPGRYPWPLHLAVRPLGAG